MSLGVGVIGCGNISGIYFQNCARFKNLRLIACADAVAEKAVESAREYGIRVLSVEQLLSDPEIDIVLNLTIPLAHTEINQKALQAGKHVYCEKPLGISVEEAKPIIDLARSENLRIGCAPDTFLGAGIQTCIDLIDQGAIGKPVSAMAFMTCHGHEGWHPNPQFYYQHGGGPMLDMGPYYLTALVAMLGPISKVVGMTSRALDKRTVGSGSLKGTSFSVEIPTHVAGLMEFANGAVGNIVTSFDVWSANLPFIEVHGTEGSLSVPDPNTFGGQVRLFTPADGWKDIALTRGFSQNSRGLGLADMADAIESNRSARASGELAYHVLSAMEGFGKGEPVILERADRPKHFTRNEAERLLK